jgi:hypothetical protein
MSSLAGDEAPPPPYQTKCDGFGVLAAFDEAVVRSLLPPGIEPEEEMSGGINLYTAEQGYGLAPYSAFYFYVHVKGLDSSDGTKARWMLQGVYGPEARVPAALHKYYGLPVRAGEYDDNRCDQSGDRVPFGSSVRAVSSLVAVAAPGSRALMRAVKRACFGRALFGRTSVR